MWSEVSCQRKESYKMQGFHCTNRSRRRILRIKLHENYIWKGKALSGSKQNLAGEFCVVAWEFPNLRCLMNTLKEHAVTTWYMHSVTLLRSSVVAFFFVQNMEPCDRKISLCYKYQRRYKKLSFLCQYWFSWYSVPNGIFLSLHLAALIVKWSPLGDSYAVAVGNKVVVYKLAVSPSLLLYLFIK